MQGRTKAVLAATRGNIRSERADESVQRTARHQGKAVRLLAGDSPAKNECQLGHLPDVVAQEGEKRAGEQQDRHRHHQGKIRQRTRE